MAEQKKPDSLNKVMKTAAQKVTGEAVNGATPVMRRYALARTVNLTGNSTNTTKMIRQAQLNNTNVTAPNFYTPFTTPSAFQIPNNRKEIYLWAQWWVDNEPKVAAAIAFYTDFPLSGFQLECANGYVKDYFEDLGKKLNFPKWLPLIAQEYHLRGDVFIMASIDCKKCHGLNRLDDGEPCDHAGATWESINILNPDTVESTGYFLGQEPEYYVMPTDEMIKVVQERKPEEVFNKIPDFLRKKIIQRAPIYLEPISIYHLKRGSAPWQPYGTSMVRPLFTTLAYKDKLRQAQWLVAERHIIPIKIVKIGSDDRPATDEDIQAVHEELTNVANDPLLTLVTHHNFDFDYYGACHDDQTEVLTINGFKHFNEVKPDDFIGCYNPMTKQLEFMPYVEKHEYDYDSDVFGPMINFKGRHLDTMVTPNHKMWTQKRKWNAKTNKYEFNEWSKVRADEITDHDKFLATLEWEGQLPHILPYQNISLLRNIELENYVGLAGYYISEGSQQWNTKYNKPYTTKISQSQNGQHYNKMYDLMDKCFGDKLKPSLPNKSSNVVELKIHNKDMGEYFLNEFGHRAENKCIPEWVRNLPAEYLEILVSSLLDGDGSRRYSENGQERFCYTTVSKQLVDGLQEILLKLGYSPKYSIDKGKNYPVYKIYWAERKNVHTIKSKNISKVEYHDKVWCFTVPTGVFVTRRNGKIGIHGNSGKVLQLTNEFELIEQDIIDGFMLNKAILNGEGPSYSNAQVGLLTLSKRLERFRQEVSYWMEERLFKPNAEWNGFSIEGKRGQEELIYPTVKWDDLELRDDTGKLQMMQTSQQAGVISAQTLIEAYGLDYDQEVERLRFEQTANFISTPNTDLGGMGGGYGAPALGGGGSLGGELPGLPPPGGGLPDAGGGEGMSEMPATASSLGSDNNYRFASSIINEVYESKVAPYKASLNIRIANRQIKSEAHLDFLESRPLVTGRGNLGPLPEEPEVFTNNELEYPIDGGFWCCPLNKPAMREYGSIRFAATGKKDEKPRPRLFSQLEQKLYQVILNTQVPYPLYAQYQAGPGLAYQLDAAMPSVKLGIEADSRTYHSSPETVAKDRQRDMALAAQGWTILRFTEEELEQQPQEVAKVLISVIKKIVGGNQNSSNNI